MHSLEGEPSYLTLEQVLALECPSEREFALRCLAVGCLLINQITIGSSVIDFLVINPKRHTNNELKPVGKLVEVTYIDEVEKEDASEKRKRIHQEMRERKLRQVEAMKASEYPWTILYGDQLKSIKKSARNKT